MIKSLSVMNKLKFFDQISHPLSAPSTASPPFETQGAIVAIEGLSADSVWNLTNSLAEQLEKDGKFAVKIFDGPNPYKFNGDSYTRGSNSSTDSQPLTVESFLATIGEWHRISREMTEYITTKPTAIRFNTTVLDRQDTHMSDAPREQPPDTAVSPRTLRKAADLSLVSPMPHLSGPASSSTNSKQPAERTSPPRRTPPTPPPPPPPPPTAAPPKASLPSPPNSSANSSPSLIPIALIPHYQLTTVDIGSMSVPILDNYSPHSHWQWLASLYRGCVGADITVVVEDIHDAAVAAAGSGASFGAHPSHSNSNSGSGNGNNSRSSISGNGGEAQGLQEGVEVRLQDARAIIVRFGLEGMALAGEGWEKAKRRVGFEVEEFLRAGR
jgi:HMG box factor